MYATVTPFFDETRVIPNGHFFFKDKELNFTGQFLSWVKSVQQSGIYSSTIRLTVILMP